MNVNKETTEQNRTDRRYDYSNLGLPRDFDIRIEVAEQQEIVRQSQVQFSSSRWHCSEYDF